ncbi:hypothetical protein BCU93_16360 [Vibrio breoganii]|uniref:Uncharacterized protein n=1 Tax=Vibrio breoganii TaxID=553239 RepID=A0ABX1U7Z2_9VIBR|nr:hypothetical protein [Vibrio breoganii]NMR69603.1 hypothetical protein [Vibrio breoganii]OCH77783.1 hypothetical protein A6D95_05550 [Vibrio breoganii]PMG02210.1 hypothetical protein BCV02_01970 [Vibrio breoganii]PMG36425.1 hypothetical protein BCU93_16360 [Vibrio breoganii]
MMQNQSAFFFALPSEISFYSRCIISLRACHNLGVKLILLGNRANHDVSLTNNFNQSEVLELAFGA